MISRATKQSRVLMCLEFSLKRFGENMNLHHFAFCIVIEG